MTLTKAEASAGSTPAKQPVDLIVSADYVLPVEPDGAFPPGSARWRSDNLTNQAAFGRILTSR